MKKTVNQVNPPQKGKSGDKVWKIYFKKTDCSMLMFKKLTLVQAMVRKNALKEIYQDWCGNFIITK